jgi:glucosamine-6-phosphate deaminase
MTRYSYGAKRTQCPSGSHASHPAFRAVARLLPFDMEILIQPSTKAANQHVAQIIANALRDNPRLVLGLATGRTMEAVYAQLAWMHSHEGLDFSACRTFNLDEYVGLEATDPNSYRYYMNHHLFSKVNIDLRNNNLPDGTAKDLAAECARYERLIAESGGIDLQLLGIGRSGHLGFNEPLSALRSRTRATALTPTTIEQNASFFGGPQNMPRHAITMGMGTILDCRQCLLLATGSEKAAILAKAVEGPITSMIPATALQLHPHCTIVADETAAAKLEDVDFYRSTTPSVIKEEKIGT